MQTFISYKREDQPFAERLHQRLSNWGFRTWIDIENIPPGAYWPEEIDTGLRGSDLVIGVLSPEAVLSRNVKNEWDWALMHNRPLILCQWRPTRELPHRYVSINYIDFTADEARAFAQLEDALKKPDRPQYVEEVVVPAPAQPIVVQTKRRTQTLEIVTPGELQPDANRAPLLDRIENSWITSILDNVLQESAFDLGLSLRTDAVLKHNDYGSYILPPTSKIATIFDDLGGEMLILGAPGAGKTVLMLQLAQELVEIARADVTQPMPIIFNLSSWADEQLPLSDWLVERLHIEYQVPRRTGQLWVENEQLLLLLDGLDEVREEHRRDCVDTINVFRRQYPTVDIAVCSRIADYDILDRYLDLQAAIVLNPLTDEKVDHALDHPDLRNLQSAVKLEPHLREMARTPFLLNTMIFTYRGTNGGEISFINSADERRDHLFDRYIKRRFESRRHTTFTLARSRHWLSWLAANMVNHKQSMFYIESLQIDWVGTREVVRLYNILGTILGSIAGLSAGLIGLAIGNFFDQGLFGLFAGLLVGWAVGVVRAMTLMRNTSIRPTERLAWRWKWRMLPGGLAAGVLIGLVVGVAAALIIENDVALIAGLFNGFTSSVIVAGILGFTRSDQVSTRVAPNQGIRNTVFNLLIFAVITGTLYAVFNGLAVAVLSLLVITSHEVLPQSVLEFTWVFFQDGIPALVGNGVILGIGTGIAAAGSFGGLDVLVKHFLVRSLAHRQGVMPWNYAQFLDHCAQLHILRRVGGGYIFVHRMLLEYFAEQARESSRRG